MAYGVWRGQSSASAHTILTIDGDLVTLRRHDRCVLHDLQQQSAQLDSPIVVANEQALIDTPALQILHMHFRNATAAMLTLKSWMPACSSARSYEPAHICRTHYAATRVLNIIFVACMLRVQSALPLQHCAALWHAQREVMLRS